MDQVQEQQKLEFLPEKSDQAMRFFKIYGMLDQQETPGDLLATLMCGVNSYFWSQKEAYDTAGQKGRGRDNYSGNVMKLMDYRVDDLVDEATEQNSIDLLTSALNNYLSDKQELPESPMRRREQTLRMVKTLMIQLISQGLYNMLSELKVPEYIKPMVDEALDALDKEADQIFHNWIEDLVELGNKFLVDYMNQIGPQFLAITNKTKSGDTYNSYLSQHLKNIKNPEQLYARYKIRRDEYDAVTRNIQKNKLYDIFDITPDSYTKAQRTLYSEFELRYNDDVNSQYIMRAIHGIN